MDISSIRHSRRQWAVAMVSSAGAVLAVVAIGLSASTSRAQNPASSPRPTQQGARNRTDRERIAALEETVRLQTSQIAALQRRETENTNPAALAALEKRLATLEASLRNNAALSSNVAASGATQRQEQAVLGLSQTIQNQARSISSLEIRLSSLENRVSLLRNR